MKHTLATNTIEGIIPHKEIKVNGVVLRMPVKLKVMEKRSGKKTVLMVKAKHSTYYPDYLPVPMKTESGYVYALPAGGDCLHCE